DAEATQQVAHLFRQARRSRAHTNLLSPWLDPSLGIEQGAQEDRHPIGIGAHDAIRNTLVGSAATEGMPMRNEELAEFSALKSQPTGIATEVRLNQELAAPQVIPLQDIRGDGLES